MARTVPFRLCPLRCRSIEGPESATGTSEFLLFYRAFCKFRHRRRCGKLTNISCRWPRGAALRGPALAPLQCHFNVTWLRCAVLPCLVHQQTGAGTRLDACAPRADAPPLQSSPIRCRSISAIAPAASSHSSSRGAQHIRRHPRWGIPVKPGELNHAGTPDHVKARILDTDREGPCSPRPSSARRRSLTNAALLHAFLALPLVTFRIVAAIHWEALRRWFKGARMVQRPNAATTNTILAAGKCNDYTGAALPAVARRKPDPRGSALVH